MIRFKEILIIFFIVSCSMPAARTKSIQERYPYWNVEIRFGATPSYRFTKENKREAVKSMALMKLIVNTKEFEEVVLNGKFYAHNSGEFPNGKWNISKSEASSKVLDNNRLLETIRNTDFSCLYSIHEESAWGVFGAVGELSYAFDGYKKYTPGKVVKLPRTTNWETSNWSGLNVRTGHIFHEHLHNIGYMHINGDGGVPYKLGDAVDALSKRIIDGDLKGKYGSDLEELTDYFMKKYEKELLRDTL